MDKVYVIRHKVLVEGLSQREVARQLGIDKETVAKYLKVSAPQRVERQARAKPVLDRVRGRIDELWEEWRGRTTAKQRVTSQRLLRQLRAEGYEVGFTTVKEYLREKRRQGAEVYIPLQYRAGEVAQVDFFEAQVEIGSRRTKIWQFVLYLPYSGYQYVWLYERCDQTSFLDAHVRAFEALKGIPQRVVYDNLGLAVRRVMGSERALTERFAALVSHYLYEPCFTRVGQGHDKGGVESSGKNLRLQYLVPIPQGESVRAVAETLLAEVRTGFETKRHTETRTVPELFAEEQACLLPLPAVPFDVRRLVMAAVSSKALVRIDGAAYSVPSTWARLEATVRVGVEDISLSCLGQELTLRKEPSGTQTIDYRNYLPELARKPQAVRQVAPQLMAQLGEPFPQLWTMLSDVYGGREAGRVLARLLGAVGEHGPEAIKTALAKALAVGKCDLLALSDTLHPRLAEPVVTIPESLRHYQVEQGHASDYDWLLAGGGQ